MVGVRVRDGDEDAERDEKDNDSVFEEEKVVEADGEPDGDIVDESLAEIVLLRDGVHVTLEREGESVSERDTEVVDERDDVDDFDGELEKVWLGERDPEIVADSVSVNDGEAEVKDKERDIVRDGEGEQDLDNESDEVPDVELEIDELGLGLEEALCVGVWDVEYEREYECEEEYVPDKESDKVIDEELETEELGVGLGEALCVGV
jgi:hypothetical protein